MTGSPVIGFAGWAFLAFAGVLLPLATIAFALGETRRAIAPTSSAEPSADDGPPRIQLYGQVVLTHVVLLAVALFVARAEGLSLDVRVSLNLRQVLAIAIGLAAVLAIGDLSWRIRSPAERERLWVRRILPRTRAERRAWIFVSAGAAVAEEIAYRGVFVTVAASVSGSFTLAVMASALAFAVVHAPQGLSSVGYVFAIALIHQAIVIATDSLAPAILVHFAYDVLAGLWLAQRHGLVGPPRGVKEIS